MRSTQMLGVLVTAAATACFLLPAGLGAGSHAPLDATYHGLYRGVPGDTVFLEYMGRGAGTLGASMIAGELTAPGEVPCDPYDTMHGTIFADGGSLVLAMDGSDCVDPLTSPGRILIHGSGTFAVAGGTGAYAGASGSGTWTVEADWRTYGADVETGLAEVAGRFDLHLTGTLELA